MTGPGTSTYPAPILEVIAHDGRQFRDTSVTGGWAPPLRDPMLRRRGRRIFWDQYRELVKPL